MRKATNKDWIILFIVAIVFIGSFYIKDIREVMQDAEYEANKTPVPAACSFHGKVVSISDSIKSELETGTHYHHMISIQLNGVALISPRDPIGHPCAEDVSNKTVVTEFRTSYVKENTPPAIDNKVLEVGEIVLGKAAYAKGYVPLLLLEYTERLDETSESQDK